MASSATLLLVIICVTVIFLLATFYNTAMHGIASDSHAASAADIERMIRVIRIQNETIHALTSHMNPKSNGPDVNSLLSIIQEKEMRIAALSDEIQRTKENSQDKSISLPSPSLGDSHSDSPRSVSYALDVPPAKLEAECESYYGMQLVDKWRQSEQVWCEPSEGATLQSSLTCYPYKQHHKSSPDMFCEATNFVIDFSKVITFTSSTHYTTPYHTAHTTPLYYEFSDMS
jgi:uncharacterized small protein (DUF1192 family)